MIISSTMAFAARAFLLLAALVMALDPAAAHAAQTGDFTGLVDIGGGRKMYLECRGVGSPTVVLVAGLRGSAEDWNIAAKPGPRVFPEVGRNEKRQACFCPNRIFRETPRAISQRGGLLGGCRCPGEARQNSWQISQFTDGEA